jgi:hypothetical protein
MKRSKATEVKLIERSLAQRQALLALGLDNARLFVGRAAAKEWRKVEQDAEQESQRIVDSIDESAGPLSALLKAEVARAVVYSYSEGFAAGAALRHAKTLAATRKSTPKKRRKKAESVAAIRAKYGQQKHTKKTLKVKAVAIALGVSERSVWDAVADLK